MSFERTIEFTKNNIDIYLKEIAKEYRRQIGKNMPAEMVLIGGASILVNYGFRDMTTDIDAVIKASSAMKDIINHVGDKFNLPNGWINEDFIRTSSYSNKIEEFSKYYKTYSNVLTIRTISSEYLIAMKLMAGRQYKSDLSDVVGILAEHEKKNDKITIHQIKKAVSDLYGKWDKLPETSQNFIKNVLNNKDIETLYRKILNDENENKNIFKNFEKKYPGVIIEENIEVILGSVKKKASTVSVLSLLRKMKENKN